MARGHGIILHVKHHSNYQGFCGPRCRRWVCTLALSPIRDTHSEGFSYFVTSIAAPVASCWSGRRVGFAPTGKRRLVTAWYAQPLRRGSGDSCEVSHGPYKCQMFARFRQTARRLQRGPNPLGERQGRTSTSPVLVRCRMDRPCPSASPSGEDCTNASPPRQPHRYRGAGENQRRIRRSAVSAISARPVSPWYVSANFASAD
jgi:hypothetical protein